MGKELQSLRAFLLSVMLLLAVSLFSPAFAQPTQLSYTVNLNWFSLQVTYPAEVMPGDTVSVTVQATPKSSSLYLQSLTATVYYADAAGLHSVTTQTLVSNPVNRYGFYGNGSFSRSFTVSVPENASRTSLVAVFSETVQFNYYALYYGGYWPYYGYGWYPNLQYGYPSYSLETRSDDALAPLSYINATTPEYVSLRSTYQTVQQRLNQTQTQNRQLQTTITRQNATISQLNEQLTSANITAQTYEAVAVVFAIIAVALAAFSVYQMRSKVKMKNTSETKET